MFVRLLVATLVLLSPFYLIAQEATKTKEKAKKKAAPERPEPTVADFAYGKDSERQKFDFWQAKSDKPTPVVLLIHGGGWMGGDKTGYGTIAIQPYLDAGISVASINYRFIPQAMEQKVEPPVKALPARRGPGAANAFARRPRSGTSIPSASARPAVRPALALRSGWRCTTTWPIPRAAIRSPANRRGSPARRSAAHRRRSIPRNCASGFPTRSTAAMPSASPRQGRSRAAGVRTADRQSREGACPGSRNTRRSNWSRRTIRRSSWTIPTRRRRR